MNGMVTARSDFAAIADWVKPGARVLDLGCGDGTLLKYLIETRGARGYGVEIDDDNIVACEKNGVNVIQMDLEAGLSIFESNSFDAVILSQTLQAMHNTEAIVKEMLRVGRQGIVTFPNFGYWKHRWQLLQGHMPVSTELPFEWYNTPNIHLCTLDDFEHFCAGHAVHILERLVMNHGQAVSFLPNLLGSLAVYRFEQAK
jgi:methionine biosynthesis protein MetW